MDRLNRMEVMIVKARSEMLKVKNNYKISIETEIADCVIIRKRIRSMFYRNVQPWKGST